MKKGICIEGKTECSILKVKNAGIERFINLYREKFIQRGKKKLHLGKWETFKLSKSTTPRFTTMRSCTSINGRPQEKLIEISKSKLCTKDKNWKKRERPNQNSIRDKIPSKSERMCCSFSIQSRYSAVDANDLAGNDQKRVVLKVAESIVEHFLCDGLKKWNGEKKICFSLWLYIMQTCSMKQFENSFNWSKNSKLQCIEKKLHKI